VEAEARALQRRGRRADAGQVNLSALSGLHAGDLMLDAAAANTANLDTPGYRARRVELAADASGGVSASVAQAPQPGVDLADQAVAVITGALLYGANARMLQARSETERTLLDVRA
jgi:flagellar hook protein FlgE